MNDLNKDIGSRIKYLREKVGLNQTALGVHLGVGKTMVSKYEAGIAKVTPEALLIFSKLFNVSFDYLISGDDRTPLAPPPTKEDALRMVLTSDVAFLEKVQDDILHLVQEKIPAYKAGLSDQELRLIEAYHCASEEIKEAAMSLLVKSAERSKGSGGGGKGFKQSNGE